MKLMQKTVRKHLYIAIGILAGINLFILLASFNVIKTQLNPEFHKYLFAKNNVYLYVQNAAKNSLADYINTLQKSGPENMKQYSELLQLLERSTTPQMIILNLDTLRDGIFQYFKGERRFLPDIYLGPQVKDNTPGIANDPGGNSVSKALGSISKINLSALLLYANRSDLIDSFTLLKFLYFLLNSLPSLTLLVFMMLVLISLAICKNFTDIAKSMKIILLTCGALNLLTATGLSVYAFIILPQNAYLDMLVLPIPKWAVISYIQDSITPTCIFLAAAGIVSIGLSLIISYLPKHIQVTAVSREGDTHDKPQYLQDKVKIPLYITLTVLIIAAIWYRGYTFRKDFDANNFETVLTKMRNTQTVTKVVSASDDTIYALQVKLVDGKTGKPVSSTRLNINGTSENDRKTFNENIVTDSTGSAKCILDKGTFRLNFDPSFFPSDYTVPAPVPFNLKKAGTTIITVSLGSIPESEKYKLGIVEIEILGSDNKPVPNVEAELQGIINAPGYPGSIYSYTNSDGIAVFKTGQGNYTVNFIGSSFPVQYSAPLPLDISVTYNEVTRYTIRLTDTAKDNNQKKQDSSTAAAKSAKTD